MQHLRQEALVKVQRLHIQQLGLPRLIPLQRIIQLKVQLPRIIQVKVQLLRIQLIQQQHTRRIGTRQEIPQKVVLQLQLILLVQHTRLATRHLHLGVQVR